MHDLSHFRNNFEKLAERLATRGGAISLDGFRDLDLKRRSAISQAEQLKARKNQESLEIGKLKRNTSMPIYEPDREKIIFENVQRANGGPLPENELRQVYERIIDVMRNIQKNEIAPKMEAGVKQTEFDVEVND